MTDKTMGLHSEFKINTTVGISIILGGLFNTGMVYEQFQQIRAEQKANAALVAMIRDNQINELASTGQIKTELTMQSGRIERMDKRLLAVEGNLMTRRIR